MKTKNIFRMLLVAVALLLGANNVKADETTVWEGTFDMNNVVSVDWNNNVQVSDGDKIRIYVFDRNLHVNGQWSTSLELVNGRDGYPSFSSYNTTGNYYELKFAENSISTLKQQGLSYNKSSYFTITKVTIADANGNENEITNDMSSGKFQDFTVNHAVRFYGTHSTYGYLFTYAGWGDSYVILKSSNNNLLECTAADANNGYIEATIDADGIDSWKNRGGMKIRHSNNNVSSLGVSKVTVVSGNDDSSTKTNVTLTYSATTASATTASIGQTLAGAPTLTVSPEGLEGVTYSSSNTDVATVAADGTVTIVGAGTTTITATFAETDTHKGATASYTLTVSKQNVTLSFSQETASAKMEKAFTPPTLTVSPEGLEGITYSSSNTGVATVSNDGSVTLVSAGTTTITASFAETAVYNSASASYTLTVAEADVPTFTVSVSEPVNGQLSASPTADVTAGTTVTITATPSEGYKLSAITVTGADETNIEVSGTGNTRTFTMPSQNVTVSATFAEIETVEATITSTTGFATFCSNKALDFTGINTIEAYYAKTVEDGNVYLLRVYGTVKAGTGLVLKGATTRIPVADSGDELEGNMLIGVSENTDVNAATDYVLTEKSGVAVFAQTGVNKATVEAGHAYLRVSAAQARTRTIDIGGDGATGIKNTFIDDEQGEKVVYNLSGQRVKNPTKGIYIINGKKVLVK